MRAAPLPALLGHTERSPGSSADVYKQGQRFAQNPRIRAEPRNHLWGQILSKLSKRTKRVPEHVYKTGCE